MRVWVTRAEPGATATAARLHALGHTPLTGSLLEVRSLVPALDAPPAETAALAFTSANAVRAFAEWSSGRHWPVFAVGDATAAAARAAGFEQVSSAQGDVAALAAVILARPPQGAILHARGREAAGDLGGALAQAGLRVIAPTLYETVDLDPPPAVAAAWGRGEVDAVLLHSPKAARVLARWLLTAAGAAPPVAHALGLSTACLAPLPAGRFAGLRAARPPAETALMDLLA